MGWKKKNAGRNPTQLAENNMVGTRRLELLTSTVSRHYLVVFTITYKNPEDC